MRSFGRYGTTAQLACRGFGQLYAMFPTDVETPLLDDDITEDGSMIMPKLRNLLVLACSADDTDKQIQVSILMVVYLSI